LDVNQIAQAPRRQTKEGLAAVLAPRSVAVVGASTHPSAVGQLLLKNIVAGGFAGPILPVNPHASSILGLPCFPTVADLPTTPDLAVIAVPSEAVVAVAEECGRKGIRGLLVVSAGFREADAAGARREEELRQILQRHGMRMVGPNCLGVINADANVNLHATFGARPLLPGSAALVTQSGAVGIALLEHAAHVGLGIARFVSMGNKTDVSGNDLLLLWEEDPGVRQVLMYLENLGNPRNFVRIARRLTKTKPITVIKSGRTAGGAKAAGSHTGALMQSDALVDALFEQCGVLRAQSVQEFFDIAEALASQPPLPGKRIAIVTNSGGPAILAVDALEAAGLEIAQPTAGTWDALRSMVPAASHTTMPLDLLAGGTPDAFRACIEALQADPNVDGLIAIWTPIEGGQDAQAQAIAQGLRGAAKPGVAVVFGHGPGTPAFEALKAAKVPVYTFPEDAVRSLDALHRLGRWRARPEEAPPELVVDAAKVRAILANAKPSQDGWLGLAEALAIAQAYGIQAPRHKAVRDAGEASTAAEQVGFPVVLKMEAPGLVHKTEAGAVRLGLSSRAEVEAAFKEMDARLRDRKLVPAGALVMAMAPQAPELLVGAVQDPLFGPVVACGSGGLYTELLRDVRVALAPLTLSEASRTVAALRIAPLLAGARGAPPADVEALRDAVLRIGRLSVDFPQLLEVEVNPLRVLPAGAGVLAVDVRIRVGPVSA